MGESHTPTTDDICKAFVLCDSNVEVEAGSSSRVPFPRNPIMDEITAGSGDEKEIMCWFIDFWNDYEGRVRLGGSYKPSNTVFHEKYAKLLLGSILSFYKYYESADSSNPIFDHF
ncbi:MAG: hypothetical protein KAS93_02030 [Gammaproteobacteria bacterium]|nr:hypothetical protein [Gammaproteobacteria bacterium]